MDFIIGMIMLFAGNFAPQGWLACEGQTLQIVQYQALYSILGTTYGGDGRTTFMLPDLRGRVPVGVGSGPGLSSVVDGQKRGAESVTLSAAQMPTHTHALNATSASGNATAPSSGTVVAAAVDVNGDPAASFAAPGTVVALSSSSIGTAGGSLPVSVLPPSLGLRYMICVEGIYPTRP